MITIAAKYIVILFGVFLISVGFLMLLRPSMAQGYLKKAGSTNLINYMEITVRMIPAAALVLSAELSKFSVVFNVLGWFMIATSIVLYFVPRRIHHNYALWCAEILKPKFIRLVSPFSMIFGLFIIYSVV